jgi:hypothetical protein
MQACVELHNAVTVDQLAEVLRATWQMYGRLHDLLSDAIEDRRLKRQDIPDDYQAITETLRECAGPAAAAEALLNLIGFGKHTDPDHDHGQAYALVAKVLRNRSIRMAEKAAFAYFAQCQGEERAKAAEIHEVVYCAALVAGLYAGTVERAA